MLRGKYGIGWMIVGWLVLVGAIAIGIAIVLLTGDSLLMTLA